jgi:short-subunit dehydrogenase
MKLTIVPSKFAVEGWTEAFAKEMHPDWNIKFLILEPGGIKTEFTKGSMEFTTPHPAYKDPSSPARILEKYIREGGVDAQSSTPERVAEVVFNVIVKQDERALPLRLPLGVDSYGMIMAKLYQTEKDMVEWKDVSESTMDEETRRVAASWAKASRI